MSDFVKMMMYRVVVTYEDPEDPEFEKYETQYFHSLKEAEMAACVLEAGEDPWYGGDVVRADVDPDPVEVEMLHPDHSRESRVKYPVPEGRAL